ncbi:MAG: hypothetical protein N4A49_12350 [Marinifilaceae bacterium]|jgi:hypothetical protein|nr:hypothetical protein [Marinifilaceae bacterium]
MQKNTPERENDLHDFCMKNIDKSQLREAPANFNSKVMDNIMQDWLSNPTELKDKYSRKQLILIFTGLALIFFIILGTDLQTVFSNSNNQVLIDISAFILKPIRDILELVYNKIINTSILFIITPITLFVVLFIDKIYSSFKFNYD